MGGGAMLTPVAGGIGGRVTTTTTTTNRRHHSSSLPFLNGPASGNSTAPLLPNRTNRPLFLGESSTRVQATDHIEDDETVGCYHDSVFRPIPSRIEVEKAISDLQRFMLGFRTSEFDWLQRMLYLDNPTMLKSLGFGSVEDAFRLIETEPSVLRMVTLIASDKSVWDALLNNKAVQNLRHSLSAAIEERPHHESSTEEPDLTTWTVNLIFDVAKAKVLKLIEQFISLATMMIQPPHQKKKLAAENTHGQLNDKLRSSLLLSIVILLIVVVTRAHVV